MRVLADGRIYGTVDERAMARVWAKPGCWEWKGSHFQTTGYAIFNRQGADGRWSPTVAHRVVYELFVGPIPDGLELDHLCRNRRCINPNHLEPVTRQVNNYRSNSPSSQQARQTHCLRGHEFTEQNTRIRSKGQRECKQCTRERDRERRPPTGVRSLIEYGETHPATCAHGHPWTEENRYVSARGMSACRVCGRERTRLYQSRKGVVGNASAHD